MYVARRLRAGRDWASLVGTLKHLTGFPENTKLLSTVLQIVFILVQNSTVVCSLCCSFDVLFLLARFAANLNTESHVYLAQQLVQ